MASVANAAANLYALLEVTLTDCATTIFLCAWAAYHPNVPEPGKGWKGQFVRIAKAISGLLSPEAILTAALSDSVFSRRALERLKGTMCRDGCNLNQPNPFIAFFRRQRGPVCKYCNLNQTHASFAYMGGFILKDAEGVHSLRKYQFFDRAIKGEIEIPQTTNEEIWDKSKMDSFGKIIVVFHTLWFIVKFIFGPITAPSTLPLGFVTLSLVLINIFCYGCWWNKPANVGVPIPVYRPLTPPETVVRIIVQQPPSNKVEELWVKGRNLYIKITFLLTLTVVGAVLSGVNFLAIIFQVFTSTAENGAWFVAAAILCFGSFILFLVFFSALVFTTAPEFPPNHHIWKFVTVMSIILGCARLCLFVLALIALQL